MGIYFYLYIFFAKIVGVYFTVSNVINQKDCDDKL